MCFSGHGGRSKVDVAKIYSTYYLPLPYHKLSQSAMAVAVNARTSEHCLYSSGVYDHESKAHCTILLHFNLVVDIKVRTHAEAYI